MLLYVYPLEKQVEHYAKYGELMKIRFREIISLAKENTPATTVCSLEFEEFATEHHLFILYRVSNLLISTIHF